MILTSGSTHMRPLEGVDTDPRHIHELVGQCLRTRELERESISRELRESTAQQLYGLSLQLSTLVLKNNDPDLMPALTAARDMAVALVDDVRLFAESVYPALIGRIGLPPAITMIGRIAAGRLPLDVTVNVERCTAPIPPALAAALYRVAEECVRNVERHAQARTLRLTLITDEHRVQLNVEDDGAGFDVATAERCSAGVGLFQVRELLAHAGGKLSIASSQSGGTRVVATAMLS